MALSRDFNTKIKDLLRASKIGPSDPEYQNWLGLASSLDDMVSTIATIKAGQNTKASGGGGQSADFNTTGTSAAMRTSVPPRIIASQKSLMTQSPLKIVANAIVDAGTSQIAGVDDPDSSFPLLFGQSAAGEQVQQNMAVHARYVNGGTALYAATASDETKFCNGIAIRGTGIPGQFLWRAGAVCQAFTFSTQVESSRLYLSVTPGFLTDDPAESGKIYNQEVGQLVKFLQPLLVRGDTVSSVANILFQYSPPDNT